LLIDLYHSQNLRDDGGVNPRLIQKPSRKRRVGERGIWVVWGFEWGETELSFEGPFASHRDRTLVHDNSDHPVWQTIRSLHSAGLFQLVPYLYESGSIEAEPIHPLGTGWAGEIPLEAQIFESAYEAAAALAGRHLDKPEFGRCSAFCPVMYTNPDVELIGVGRLLYRPRTRRTAQWYGQLSETARTWIETYQRIRNEAVVGIEDFRCADDLNDIPF
jgi:hypothetical protein